MKIDILFVSLSMSKIWYVVSCTEEDDIHSCGHKHRTVAEAMKCLVPDRGSFIRAFEAGIFRLLNERELIDVLEELESRSSSSRR